MDLKLQTTYIVHIMLLFKVKCYFFKIVQYWWYIWSQQTEVFPGHRIVALTAVRATI